MAVQISDDAQTIINAGIKVAVDEKSGGISFAKVDRAVDDAVGDVFGRYAGTDRGNAAPIDALREIVRLFVREKAREIVRSAGHGARVEDIVSSRSR